MTRLDPRSPLVLDTLDVGRRPGSMAKVEREIVADDAFGTDVMAVPAGEPLAFAGRMESVVEGVLVSGSVRGIATGACVRCLDEVHFPVDVDIQELFAYADRHAHHHEVGDVDADTEHVIEDGLIDLEPVLRDAVVTSLPYQPLCRPDCPGLCSECGAPLAADPDHRHDVIDPRWSALQDLGSGPIAAEQEKRT